MSIGCPNCSPTPNRCCENDKPQKIKAIGFVIKGQTVWLKLDNRESLTDALNRLGKSASKTENAAKKLIDSFIESEKVSYEDYQTFEAPEYNQTKYFKTKVKSVILKQKFNRQARNAI